MSQKKVDKRKQSKGDMLHAAKKQMKITVAIEAAVLVAIAVIVGIVTYSSGYDSGKDDGIVEGYSAYEAYLDALESLNAQTTTAAKGDKETTTADADKETTKADKETTKADKETTKADSEKETTTEAETEASNEK